MALGITDSDYESFLHDLKERIQSAQVRAALAVNRELVLLYWQIGREILVRQQQQGWGAKVIDRLAKDLKQAFPDTKGFSRSNLLYMRAMAEAYPDAQIVQQLVGQIPWGHNVRILDALKDYDERLWYIQQTIQQGWSRNVLLLQIERDLYHRQGGAITNFDRTLPTPQSDLAQQITKDTYCFDFLTIANDAKERELEKALVDHICHFLLEMGVGFAFLGSQFPLVVSGKEYRLDLLFYHVQLHCYVIVDLKMGEFEPEFSGKMNFYIAAVDDLLKTDRDEPTIGLILCKSQDKTTVEYALRNLSTPIGIATHQIPVQMEGKLPSIEQLEMELQSKLSSLSPGTISPESTE